MSDKALSEDEVRAELRRVLAAGGKYGRKAWRCKHNFTDGYLSNVLSGRAPPGARLCEALGIRKTMRHRRVVESRYERRHEERSAP